MAIRDLIPFNRMRRHLPVRKADYENPFYALQREMNRMFDNFFRDFNLAPFDAGFGTGFPVVDIRENDREVIVTAELPGVDEKDLDISVSDQYLTLRGEKREEREERNGNYYRMERSYGSFHRDISLPCEVETDKVEAVFKRGVLTITLPKKEEARRHAKRIEIKSA